MKQQSYDDEKHIHFITFSCFKRRKYAKTPRAKRIIIGSLGSQLTRLKGICLGYVIMPDHVHTLIWFPQTGQLSDFLDHWKNQSSFHLKQLFRTKYPQYWSGVDDNDPIWQTRHYGFNIWNRKKSLRNSITCTQTLFTPNSANGSPTIPGVPPDGMKTDALSTSLSLGPRA